MQSSFLPKMRIAMVLCLMCLKSPQAADQKPEAKTAVTTPAPLIGVGVALQHTPQGYVIGSVLPNTPAALSSEIEPGDTVIGVTPDDFSNEVDVRKLELGDVMTLIRGPLDSEVRLRIIPNTSTFIKEKVVALKRRHLFGDKLIGKKLDVTFTAVNDRKPLTVERFEDRLVLLLFWSKDDAERLGELFETIEGLVERDAIFDNVELIAVNCDESIDAADTNSQNFNIQGLRHVWLDPKTAKTLNSGASPMFIIVSPTGTVDTVCPPDAINLEKVLLQYAPSAKPGK